MRSPLELAWSPLQTTALTQKLHSADASSSCSSCSDDCGRRCRRHILGECYTFLKKIYTVNCVTFFHAS